MSCIYFWVNWVWTHYFRFIFNYHLNYDIIVACYCSPMYLTFIAKLNQRNIYFAKCYLLLSVTFHWEKKLSQQNSVLFICKQARSSAASWAWIWRICKVWNNKTSEISIIEDKVCTKNMKQEFVIKITYQIFRIIYWLFQIFVVHFCWFSMKWAKNASGYICSLFLIHLYICC